MWFYTHNSAFPSTTVHRRESATDTSHTSHRQTRQQYRTEASSSFATLKARMRFMIEVANLMGVGSMEIQIGRYGP